MADKEKHNHNSTDTTTPCQAAGHSAPQLWHRWPQPHVPRACPSAPGAGGATASPADNSSCPVPGKKRMALTPLVCPLQEWIQRLGRKQLSLSLRLSLGGASQDRPCTSGPHQVGRPGEVKGGHEGVRSHSEATHYCNDDGSQCAHRNHLCTATTPHKPTSNCRPSQRNAGDGPGCSASLARGIGGGNEPPAPT
jgi:hypothetical protein